MEAMIINANDNEYVVRRTAQDFLLEERQSEKKCVNESIDAESECAGSCD